MCNLKKLHIYEITKKTYQMFYVKKKNIIKSIKDYFKKRYNI